MDEIVQARGIKEDGNLGKRVEILFRGIDFGFQRL
jgi:hypothetical protein